MLSPAVRHLFGLSMPQSSVDLTARSAPQPTRIITPGDRDASQNTKEEPRTPWPAARLALTNQLWGAGFIFPGGELETLRLARPLGTSAQASLLIIGVGNGGPASSVTRNLGAWVTGIDNDPSLLAAARGLISKADLGKKVKIDSWDPANPNLVAKSHHHCLALEPLHGERPEPILSAMAKALKPNGQLVITELTTNAPLDESDPIIRRWAALERRNPANMVTGVSITRMLGRVGLDVRIAEDISDRHLSNTMVGWRVLVRKLDEQKQNEQKPDPQEAAILVAEAELWLLRQRLMKDGRLRMMRWHAFNRVPVV
jgi:SAM-dependent methyltransferase